MNWKSLSKLVLREKVCQKAKFENFYKFYSLWKLCWKAKIFIGKQNPWNSLTILTLLTNRSNSLSNTLSLDLQSSIVKNETWGVKNEGLYRYHRWRLTKGSPNKWFITLRKLYRTFILATINTPFQQPSLADG